MGENGKEFLCKFIRDTFHIPTYRLVLSTMYSGAALVTTVLNLLILISIWKTPSLHKPSYILIGSLALSDLLIGAIASPLMAITNIAAIRVWSMEVFCRLFYWSRVIAYACGAVSLVTLTAISLDRLLAVKLRNRYQSVVTKKRILCGLLTCWIVSSVVFGTLFGKLSLNDKNTYAAFLFGGVLLFILLITITVCYSMAFYSLRKITSSSVTPSVQNDAVVAGPSPNIDVAKYRKSLVTMLVVFVLTILFYTPYFCMLVITSGMVSKGVTISKKFSHIIVYFGHSSEFVSLLNSAMNPLVYLWRIRDIRESVKTTVKTILRIF